MTQTTKQTLGVWGEEQAVKFLERHGYMIMERNFRIQQGEIDIVALSTDKKRLPVWSFIEVKTRSYGPGSAERATGREKLARLERAARVYCLRHRIDMNRTAIMFEHVSLYVDAALGTARCIKYIIPV